MQCDRILIILLQFYLLYSIKKLAISKKETDLLFPALFVFYLLLMHVVSTLYLQTMELSTNGSRINSCKCIIIIKQTCMFARKLDISGDLWNIWGLPVFGKHRSLKHMLVKHRHTIRKMHIFRNHILAFLHCTFGEACMYMRYMNTLKMYARRQHEANNAHTFYVNEKPFSQLRTAHVAFRLINEFISIENCSFELAYEERFSCSQISLNFQSLI